MSTPRELLILLSAPMVCSTLEGRKTQTRRIVKPKLIPLIEASAAANKGTPAISMHAGELPCPYGQPGDRLIVREDTWMWCEKIPNGKTKKGRDKFMYVPLREAPIFYCASHPTKPLIGVACEYRGYAWGWRKKLGRFMPRWASRITLEVVGVRVEHLQSISEEDASAEGVPDGGFASPIGEYRMIWESIYGPGSWDVNPLLWVVEYRRVQK